VADALVRRRTQSRAGARGHGEDQLRIDGDLRDGAAHPLRTYPRERSRAALPCLRTGPRRDRGATLTDGILIFSDLYYPGWKATLDGRPVPSIAPIYALRAVAVPAGKHRIEFIYDPSSFKAGVAVSLIGILALVALIARHRAKGRKPAWTANSPASWIFPRAGTD